MSLYQDITALSKAYLGPAAEQFIAKQCRNYLKIEPESLGRQHLGELAKWVEVAGTRFMDDVKSRELAARIARV